MANFEYPFTSSGTPNSFPIPGADGVVGIDSTGLLTPKVIGFGDSVVLLLTATKTDAEVATLVQAWLNRQGYSTGEAGGRPAQTTVQIAPALTEVAAAD